MNNEIYSLFEKSGAVLSGHFLLSSGKHSNLYLQCARLLQSPCKAEQVADQLNKTCQFLSVDLVISPALGGLIIGYELARQMRKDFIFTERKNNAMALRRGFEIYPGARYLVTEDVITTGHSSLEVARIVEGENGSVAGFACLVNRSNSNHCLPQEPLSLLQLQGNLYSPHDCPLCKSGEPLIQPGSKQV